MAERLRDFDAAEQLAQVLANETGKWTAVIEVGAKDQPTRYAVRSFASRPNRRILGLITWFEKENTSG